jgi:hypothetical protein
MIAVMTALPRTRMTVDEYLAWPEEQPGRYELLDGAVVAMSPEGAGHAEMKAAVHAALLASIRARSLACHALPDGMTVRIDDATAYEPDALVYCGSKLSPLAVEVPDPVVVVEVLSLPPAASISQPSWRLFPPAEHRTLSDCRSRKAAHRSPCARNRRHHSHPHRERGERAARSAGAGICDGGYLFRAAGAGSKMMRSPFRAGQLRLPPRLRIAPGGSRKPIEIQSLARHWLRCAAAR